MSHLKYSAYKGVGERNKDKYGYSQAVRIGDRIEIAGQGGWHRTSGEYSSDVNTQIDQAFDNVDATLRDAGGKGWDQVFRVNSYHVPLNDEALFAMVRNLKKWAPHAPIWTTIGVPRLGEDEMKVEIEVVAHDPKDGA